MQSTEFYAILRTTLFLISCCDVKIILFILLKVSDVDELSRHLVITLLTKVINETSFSSLKNIFYRNNFLYLGDWKKKEERLRENVKEGTDEDLRTEKRRVLFLILKLPLKHIPERYSHPS